MCMIKFPGPPTSSKFWMPHTLVVAPNFLAIYTKARAPLLCEKTACRTKYLPHLRCHVKKRFRLHRRRPFDRAGALPVKSYALPNSLTVYCPCHRLHNGLCGDGSTGPLIHRGRCGPSHLKSIPASHEPAIWTWPACQPVLLLASWTAESKVSIPPWILNISLARLLLTLAW
jgi:hypothetical protein